MFPFWLSGGGGSHVTSSWLAVSGLTWTFCGAIAGAEDREKQKSNWNGLRVLANTNPCLQGSRGHTTVMDIVGNECPRLCQSLGGLGCNTFQASDSTSSHGKEGYKASQRHLLRNTQNQPHRVTKSTGSAEIRLARVLKDRCSLAAHVTRMGWEIIRWKIRKKTVRHRPTGCPRSMWRVAETHEALWVEEATGTKTSLTGGKNAMLPVEEEERGSCLATAGSGAITAMPAPRKLYLATQLPVHVCGRATWRPVAPRQPPNASFECESLPLPPSHRSTSWGALPYLNIKAKDEVTGGAAGSHSVPHSH